jgi:ATP-binding cassette, subfamily A (ABC1), member 3
MEEASHLASRAAILSQRILAIGSINNLRMKWGDVYHVHLVLRSAPESGREEMDDVERWVKGRFEEANMDAWGSVRGQIRFSVPATCNRANRASGEKEEGRGDDGLAEMEISRDGEAKGKGIRKEISERKGGVAELFRKLEASKEELGLAFYSVRATTMDEVFLNVVRENNVREVDGRGK